MNTITDYNENNEEEELTMSRKTISIAKLSLVRLYDSMNDNLKMYLMLHPETTQRDVIGMIKLMRLTYDPEYRKQMKRIKPNQKQKSNGS